MPGFEERFETACKAHVIPGAVLVASDKTGDFYYAKAFGVHSLEPGKEDQALALDAPMLIASCTKLMTTIAAMQCVEKGLIGLDDDVAKVLPDLAALEILDGFDDDGKPKLKKRQNKITLRLMLTHSAGLGYDLFHPLLQQYCTYEGKTIGSGGSVPERFSSPLLFEPGTSWVYGTNMDWAGKLVERLTESTLEEHMQQHIWKPLGIEDMTFYPEKRPGFEERMPAMTERDPLGTGRAVHYSGSSINDGATDCLGGQGAYGSIPEYVKILRSLLADDEKLLKKATTAQMFEPHLSDESLAAMDAIRAVPEFWQPFVGYFPPEIKLDWGLGGIITMEDDEGWRRKGTMMWSGLPNLFWWIDREQGLCGMYGGQLVPPGDMPVEEMIKVFEKGMYEMVGAKK